MKPMTTLRIIRLGNGWYDFKNIPQDKSYIKIHGLHCGSDEKALDRAVRIMKSQAPLSSELWDNTELSIIDREEAK